MVHYEKADPHCGEKSCEHEDEGGSATVFGAITSAAEDERQDDDISELGSMRASTKAQKMSL